MIKLNITSDNKMLLASEHSRALSISKFIATNDVLNSLESVYHHTQMMFAVGDRMDVELGTMVFDWDKAEELVKKHDMKNVVAGLKGDMGATADYIYREGEMVETGAYLGSFHCKPVMIDEDTNTEYFCYTIEN